MPIVLWIVLAIIVALAWSFLAIRRTHRMLSPDPVPTAEALPMTVVQRVVWQALALTLLCFAAASVIVANYGILAVWDNDRVRILVTALLIAGLGGYTYYITRLRTWLMRDDGSLDERDRAILAAAPAGQAPAMMVAMAAWMIYLTESFRATHLVPSAYLYAMFWTLLMVSILASLLGILVGYRRG
jgi:hypothetical protein